MARQSSIFKFEGLLDDVSFYKSSGEFRVRRKGGANRDRIANDPAFRKFRAHTLDFTRASSAAKLLRKSIEGLLNQATDPGMVNRLICGMFNVVKADVTNPKGRRTIIDGDVELLTGFDFNTNATLSTVLRISSRYSIDRGSGLMSVDLPSFDPQEVLSAPKDCTHFKIKLAGSAIDFANNEFVTDTTETGQKLMTDDTQPVQLACRLPVNSVHPLFLVHTIEFFVKENGASTKKIKEHSNPLSIVKVSGV